MKQRLFCFFAAMLQKELIIAIDGYSSCGKSTLAKALSKKLNLRYIDSGAMYRAVTLYFLENNIPVPNTLNQQQFDYAPVMEKINITFKYNEETLLSEIYLNNKPVEKQIRLMNVSDNVSNVSALKVVRQHMVSLQQNMENEGGLVMDGRDIGTTVFPNASLKIFMTANPTVRAERRYKEFISKGENINFGDVLRNLEKRDYEDTHRLESPLVQAEDAIVLDNTHLSEQQQVEFVLIIINDLLKESKVLNN